MGLPGIGPSREGGAAGQSPHQHRRAVLAVRRTLVPRAPSASRKGEHQCSHFGEHWCHRCQASRRRLGLPSIDQILARRTTFRPRPGLERRFGVSLPSGTLARVRPAPRRYPRGRRGDGDAAQPQPRGDSGRGDGRGSVRPPGFQPDRGARCAESKEEDPLLREGLRTALRGMGMMPGAARIGPALARRLGAVRRAWSLLIWVGRQTS